MKYLYDYYNYYASIIIVYQNKGLHYLIPELDLHGLKKLEASSIFYTFFKIWKEKNISKAIVIPGKFRKGGIHEMILNKIKKNNIKFNMLNIGSILIEI